MSTKGHHLDFINEGGYELVRLYELSARGLNSNNGRLVERKADRIRVTNLYTYIINRQSV